MGNIRKENEDLKEKCVSYEAQLEDLKGKVMDHSEKIDEVCSDSKLAELKNAWKKERKEEKVSFAEMIKKQIQDNIKDTVMQIIKEKENLGSGQEKMFCNLWNTRKEKSQ